MFEHPYSEEEENKITRNVGCYLSAKTAKIPKTFGDEIKNV
jgi:hypothetical protein